MTARGDQLRRPGRHVRRGLSFLEAVAAMAMLGIAAASIFAATGYIIAASSRQQQQLGAAELANRLILQYLDDEASLPRDNSEIRYGPWRYVWELSDAPVTLREAVKLPPASPSGIGGTLGGTQSPIRSDRLRQITVRVTMIQDELGRRPAADPPAAALTRVVDPVFLRNPDSLDNTINTPEGRERLVKGLMGAAGAITRGGAPAANTPQKDAAPAAGGGGGSR